MIFAKDFCNLSLTAVADGNVIVPSVGLLPEEMIPKMGIYVIHTIPLVRGVITVRRAVAVQTLRYTLGRHIALKVADGAATLHLRCELQYLLNSPPNYADGAWYWQQPEVPQTGNKHHKTSTTAITNERNRGKL